MTYKTFSKSTVLQRFRSRGLPLGAFAAGTVAQVLVIYATSFFLWRGMHSGTVSTPTLPSAAQVPPPAEVIPPFGLQKGNIVASDAGGVIESITSEYGPGYTGNLLIDGSTATAWMPRNINFPQEMVFSFFNRQPALISSVVITAPAASAPKDVEVWTSTSNPADGFQRVAAQTLAGTGRDQAISFPPVEAAYVKLRILSGQQPSALELQEVQIVEGQRADYIPLNALHPDMAVWKTSPRHAAQRGIEWLETAAMEWQTTNNCYGCHVQSQVMMGLAISKGGKYVVNDHCLEDLTKFVATSQSQDGSISDNPAIVTATQFGAMGLAAVDKLSKSKSKNDVLTKSVDWLLTRQEKTGEMTNDQNEPPIDQGTLMTTANSVTSFFEAYDETGDIHYKQGAQHALAWIAAAPTETTQDEVFKVIALSLYGNTQQKSDVQRLVKQLKFEQKGDGGWQETVDAMGSNAFSTGQVLYAFKQAGVSVESPEFERGVRFLLGNQKENGAWPSMNSKSGRPSEFAPTMWAVIGLAGSFREAECAEVERQPGKIIIRLCSRALFDFNRYDLKREAQAVLAGVKAALLDRYPGTPLGIEGYTDDIGDIPYNLKLSMDRAKSVSEWLEQQGVEPSRIKPVGFGKGRPRYPNTNEENRARNRRVEIVITMKENAAVGMK